MFTPILEFCYGLKTCQWELELVRWLKFHNDDNLRAMLHMKKTSLILHVTKKTLTCSWIIFVAEPISNTWTKPKYMRIKRYILTSVSNNKPNLVAGQQLHLMNLIPWLVCFWLQLAITIYYDVLPPPLQVEHHWISDIIMNESWLCKLCWPAPATTL